MNSKELGDPLYWAKHFEPLHIALLRIVRGYWGQNPPVSDLQLQFTAHYAGKHCLESVVVSRLANEAGAHATAVGLLRHAVEALDIVAISICHHLDKVAILQRWDDEKISQGDIRRILEEDVWPMTPLKGLWNQSWADFWKSLSKAVQPYAHFSPPLMRWHQKVEELGDKLVFWINDPRGDAEQFKADRIAYFQLLVFWAFAEIVRAFRAAPDADLDSLTTLADSSRQKLASSPTFFTGGSWDTQLLPFVWLKNERYRQ